jgi:glycosyltransferase involved in cell wall biosynthesis
MTPRISIITPSFNQGRFIERTIQSVLSQDVPSLEYVVVDGGSTDETVSILKRYGTRLRWISEPDNGHSDAINKGLSMTSGSIVGWLNSDDIYYPGALRNVVRAFDDHCDVRVLYGRANHIDEQDGYLNEYPTEAYNWERLKETCFISQPAAFLRRSVFQAFGPLDVTLRQSMDYEYWLRLGKAGVPFLYLDALLAATRLHKDAFTVASSVSCHRACNDLTRRHLGRTPDSWLFKYALVVVRDSGLKKRSTFGYALGVVLVSVYASLRWNHRVSRTLILRLFTWIRTNISSRMRRERQR